MSGPWDNYAPAPAEPAGPWNDYARSPRPATMISPNAQAMRERGMLKGPVEIGQLPQGVNEALYQTVSMPGDAFAWGLKQLGLRDPNALPPSETVRGSLTPRAPRTLSDLVTDSPGAPLWGPVNRVPETVEGRAFNDVGQAVGTVASTALPFGAATQMMSKTPSLARGIAETLAAQPGMQVASNSLGNLTTDFTGNPLLGMAASFAPATLMHGAMRVPYSAPARTGAEAERRALLADAKNEGILPSFGTIQNSPFAKMTESVISKLPFMGNAQAKITENNKTAFNKAALDKIPEVRGEGMDAATPGQMDAIGARIGKKFNALEDGTTVNIDPQFGTDIAKAKADFSQQLRSQMPKNIMDKLDELQSAADALKPKPTPPRSAPSLDKYPSTDVSVWVAPTPPAPVPGNPTVSVDGTTYKNIRSKLSAALPTASGTDKQAIGAMINALDGAVERSLPKDMVKDWQEARQSWRRFKMVEGATDARHNGQTDVGHIPPGSLAARAGSDKEMERLASMGTSFVGDKMPDSGTAGRMLVHNLMGLGAGGAGMMAFPTTTAILAGSGYATNAMLNNPYTRRALIDRLQNSREGVLNKGLVATLAAQGLR